MAIAIVGGAFVDIHEDVIRFAELLELLFGVRVVRIFVRMKFDRQLPIRALDLVFVGLAADGEDFVIISFGRGGHLL